RGDDRGASAGRLRQHEPLRSRHAAYPTLRYRTASEGMGMGARRILLDGLPTTVTREGDELVAADGRRMPLDEPVHLPPTDPAKILCVHLNYESRRAEFGAALGAAPTYFQKPTSALNAHGGQVVRPPRCRYLNYEGEIAIVIDAVCRHVAPEEAGAFIRGYTVANDYGLHDF